MSLATLRVYSIVAKRRVWWLLRPPQVLVLVALLVQRVSRNQFTPLEVRSVAMAQQAQVFSLKPRGLAAEFSVSTKWLEDSFTLTAENTTTFARHEGR